MSEQLKLDFDEAVAALDAHVGALGEPGGQPPNRDSSTRTEEDNGWILRCYHPRFPGWQGTVYDSGRVVTPADCGELRAVITDRRKLEMLRVLEYAPWRDSLRWIADLEATLALLEAATERDAEDWGTATFAADGPFGEDRSRRDDECFRSPDAVASMLERERLRYVGRLVRSLRLQYGDRERSNDPWQPGGLLRLLDPCQPADLLHLLADTYR